jgi:hypothetical protein
MGELPRFLVGCRKSPVDASACPACGWRAAHAARPLSPRLSPNLAWRRPPQSSVDSEFAVGRFANFRARARRLRFAHGHAARDPVESGHRPGSVQARTPPACRRAPAQALRRRPYRQSGRAGRIDSAAPLARHRGPPAARRRGLAPLRRSTAGLRLASCLSYATGRWSCRA